MPTEKPEERDNLAFTNILVLGLSSLTRISSERRQSPTEERRVSDRRRGPCSGKDRKPNSRSPHGARPLTPPGQPLQGDSVLCPCRAVVQLAGCDLPRPTRTVQFGNLVYWNGLRWERWVTSFPLGNGLSFVCGTHSWFSPEAAARFANCYLNVSPFSLQHLLDLFTQVHYSENESEKI